MFGRFSRAFTAALALTCATAAVAQNMPTPGFKLSAISNYTTLATSNQSALYQVNLEDASADYQYPVYLIQLQGSRFQMGYDYGVMMGQQSVANYNSLLYSLIGHKLFSVIEIELVALFCDWQWNNWLSKQVPVEYLEELNGIQAGGQSIGISNLSEVIVRGIVLANLPGDLGDIQLVLERELADRRTAKADYPMLEAMKRLLPKLEYIKGLQCSMFAVWGSRTMNGNLYAARNLDWNQDTGINRYKLITVHAPDDGKFAHATVGYAGLYGALAGMSSQGLTVHEANLEESEITFSGFPWILRLRYVMENARNLSEALSVWQQTNNTVGFNHMVSSASDVASGHAAVAFETMFDYTAYFQDDDPREQNATYVDPKTEQSYQIGYPLREALWRTNHGYDPVIRQHFLWSQAPSSWSVQRYMFAYEGFTFYENSGIQMDAYNAINLTSILGDKGQNPYQCQATPDGSNVISVTFSPAEQLLWAAWEDGTGSSWKPGTCATYVAFNMSNWW